MSAKEYRVVCSQPQFSDEIYIDITPSSGVTHEQILFSRYILHRQTNNQPLSSLYGSIYLQDNNGNIIIDFPPPQARIDSPEYQGIMKQYNALRPQIIERYKRMRQSGQESTLHVYSHSQMYELSETKRAEAEAFERKCWEKWRQVEEKTGASSENSQNQVRPQTPQNPQTPQEEERKNMSEEFTAARKRRIAGEQKRSTQKLAAWQRFQRDYSGD